MCGADRLPASVPGAVLPPWVYLAAESAKWLRLRDACARPVVRGADEALTVWQVGSWTLEHGVSLDPTAPPPVDPRILARVDDMTVRIVAADGATRECDAPQLGRAWCGPDPWNWVGPTRVPVRGVDSECLWAHPTPEGVLAIGWEIEGPVQLHLRHALGDGAADGGGSVEVAVVVDGEERTRRTHRPRPGWQSQRVQVPEAGPHRVEVHVSAVDAGRRHLCLDGEFLPLVARAPVVPLRGPTLVPDSEGSAAPAAQAEEAP